MGIYFAAIGIGNKLAGMIGEYSEEKFDEKNYFHWYYNCLCLCRIS